MRVAVAMDSFKGSLSSLEAGMAVKEAIRQVNKDSLIDVLPLADGGEGTVHALHSGLGGQWVDITVMGPIGTSVNAGYCILPDGTAVMEMATAAGLTLLLPSQRNPLETTTFGVGQMIADAVSKGCRNFIIGIGGSTTNDGGTGMLSALGFAFLDAKGKSIPLGAKGLEKLHGISVNHVLPELAQCHFRIACDVTNPLFGENGCSAVFGPQKGATAEMIADMDNWLENYARLSSTVSSKADPHFPGAGAAGGLGFAFLAFTNAVLESGVQIVLEQTNLESYIKNADIVITGEGRLDTQTVMGKAPIGVAALAKKYGKPVIAFCGCTAEGVEICNDHGIDAYFPILQTVTTLEDALAPETAIQNLMRTAAQVFHLISTIGRN